MAKLLFTSGLNYWHNTIGKITRISLLTIGQGLTAVSTFSMLNSNRVKYYEEDQIIPVFDALQIMQEI